MNKSSTNYRQLLATVDLGETTGRVVARAGDLGRRCGAGVDLANIFEGWPVFLYHAVLPEELEVILDKGARWSRECLEELAAKEPGIHGIHTANGILAEEACALAERIEADLLVVGAHARRGMAILLRDHSDEILHRAPCDTLVVKQGEPGQSSQGPAPYRHLLAAVDLGEWGERVVARAARVAEIYGAMLTLVHVIDRFPVDRSNAVIAPEDQDPLAFEQDKATDRLCELARAAGASEYRHQVVVSTSTASREIPLFAADNGVDLIVVGSHSRHGMGRLLGSTANGVVHRATCDVLVVRTPMAP